MSAPIDLRKCKKGDKLVSVHGMILEYVGPYDGPYPHEVRYPDGSRGTRLDNGQVYKTHRLPSDHDIVAIKEATP